MNLSAPDAVALAGVIGIAVLVTTAAWVLARIFRQRRPGQPGSVGLPIRLVAWVATAYAVFVILALLIARDHRALLDLPFLTVGVVLIGAPILLAWLAQLDAQFGLLARVARRADRGDLDGAIAQLRAVVDRRPAPAAPAAPAPFDPADPYAPPASAATGVGDRRWLARLNLLGILHARRGDWPAALDCFERADRAGGGEPIYSLNRGEALIMLGQAAEGLHVATVAIDRVPAVDPLKRHQLNLSLARTLLDAGHRAAAVDAIEAAAAALRRAPVLRAARRAALHAEVEAVRGRLADPTPRPTPEEAPR